MTALAPTIRNATRPTAHIPDGWRCSTPATGGESWTWTRDGIPLVAVLVSSIGEVSPPMVRDPLSYWMPPERLRTCAAALDELAVYLGARR